MPDASAGLHEPREHLSTDTIETHRAIVSLIEELEAVDWYAQRIDASADPELRAILEHNRDEEKEHAAMALEWWRRRDPKLDAHLRRYLFSSGSIAGQAEAAEGGEPEVGELDTGELRIGSLHEELVS